MKKILIATHVKFWLEDKGSSKRISSILKYISEKTVGVYVYYSGFVDKQTVEIVRQEYPKIEIFSDNYDRKIRHTKFFKKTTSKIFKLFFDKYKYGKFFGALQPKGFAGKYAYYRKRYFNQLVGKIRPDIILIEYVSLAYLIEDISKKTAKRPLLLIDTHDILYLRNESFKCNGMKHWVDISREQEIQFLNKFDIVIAIQKKEKEILEKMLPGKPVFEVPYPYAVNAKDNVEKYPVSIGFVGTSSPENKDAIVDFIENVWTDLYEKFGENVSLDIYGKICKSIEEYRNTSGVEVHGVFNELMPVYDGFDIVINPVRSGGGLKIKNVEALCHSLPLVTTSCGAHGLEDGANDVFVCCDSHSEQIFKISELVENFELRKRYSEKAFQYALVNFSEENCYGKFCELI
jgi:glycosyltransferase involved in cell wall biosynthesis